MPLLYCTCTVLYSEPTQVDNAVIFGFARTCRYVRVLSTSLGNIVRARSATVRARVYSEPTSLGNSVIPSTGSAGSIGSTGSAGSWLLIASTVTALSSNMSSLLHHQGKLFYVSEN